MCILFVEVGQDDRSITLLANRDEFWHRQTQSLHQWADGIVAGMDLEQGGTWLALNPNGAFAALTNIRDPSKAAVGKRSRGEIPLAFVRGEYSAQSFGQWLQAHCDDYGGFNCLFGRVGDVWLFDGVTLSSTQLSPGRYAISNGATHDLWPKMRRGLALWEDVSPSMTWLDILQDTQKPPDDALPRTGVPFDVEQHLGSVFIERFGEQRPYGTVSSSRLTLTSAKYRLEELNYRSPSVGGLQVIIDGNVVDA
ncbi:MAG: NRDE family protein [Gammaproteobacteria bacterium]|nr:NRDE family protein [Gammaproteobacteria bacterium]